MAFGRMARTGAQPAPMSEINVTPLVDVMLVLLVIFMLTAPLMTSKIRLQLPQANAPASDPATSTQAVTLAIDAQGHVFLDDAPVAPEALDDALARVAQANRQAEVQIRADRSVPYGTVAAVMAQVNRAGLSRLGFVTDRPAKSAPRGATEHLSPPPATAPPR